MNNLRIRLDPMNPGQFFACCGLLELCAITKPNTLAWFDLDRVAPHFGTFVIEDHAEADLAEVISRLKQAQLSFPSDKAPAAIRPAVVVYDGRTIVLDWWLDEFRREPSRMKCWAGQVTSENVLSELLPLLDFGSGPDGLFDQSAMTKAKFGVDPRSAWNALDFGFSPNEHGRDTATFPAVEVLAAIGLQGFRPAVEHRSGVFYHAWQNPLPASVARQAFREPWDGLKHTTYTFAIAKRGQSYKYFTFAE